MRSAGAGSGREEGGQLLSAPPSTIEEGGSESVVSDSTILTAVQGLRGRGGSGGGRERGPRQARGEDDVAAVAGQLQAQVCVYLGGGGEEGGS